MSVEFATLILFHSLKSSQGIIRLQAQIFCPIGIKGDILHLDNASMNAKKAKFSLAHKPTRSSPKQ